MQHVSSRDSCVYGKCGIVFVCTLPKVGWDLVESGIPSPCSIPQVEGGKTGKKKFKRASKLGTLVRDSLA